jgi:peptidoglycan/LPS O-acetylase OafA/YrhL
MYTVKYIIGIFNKILSWQIWTPLARLSYSAYLVHQIILVYFYSSMQHPFYLQDETMVYFKFF